MIVIAELHAGGTYLFADHIELVRIPSPIIQRKAPFVCRIRALVSGRGTNNVSYAQFMTKRKNLIQVPMQIVRWMMFANKFQSCIIHGRLDLRRAVVEV